MGVLGRTAYEFVGLGVLGVLIGFAVNGTREKHIMPTKNYFDMGTKTATNSAKVANPPPVEKTASANKSAAQGQAEKPKTTPASANAQPDAVPANPATDDSGEKNEIVHGYRAISTEKAMEWFKSPDYASGLNVFVDARSDEKFAEGHIPGAVQCDHYFLKDYLDATLERVKGVARVIVYCNGGDCEDSGYVCKDLEDAGVPPDAIYLYAAGWKEWSERNYPIEKGGEDD